MPDRRVFCGLVVFVLVVATLSPGTAQAAGRSKVQLDGEWKFLPSNTLTGAEAVDFDDSAWAAVTVPHTWDTVTSVTRYTNSWYRTHFAPPEDASDGSVYIYFEGAFQVADVYVNGVYLGQHRGGYTRFIFEATGTVNFGGDNVLAVRVSNAACGDCLPDGTPRLFKGYGGIYRKVWYITTSSHHVATTDFASSGVYITPFNVSADSAEISIRTLVTNDEPVDQTLTVKHDLNDASNNQVLSLEQDVVVPANTTVEVSQSGTVWGPHLWNPGDPYLYDVYTSVLMDGATNDCVLEHTGFRSYQLTATDFIFNGSSLKLRGVSKHQETEQSANAVTDAELIADWDNLVELGVNYVRLVHYPHAEIEYTLADQRGILVWAENGQTNGGPPTENGRRINREMVLQNYNHPAIVFWSAGNESPGVAAVSQYAADIRAADPLRPVVYASNGQSPSNVDYIFHNIYPGWYGGSMYDWNSSGFHWISESGAGMVIGTQNPDYFNTTRTVDSYEPEQYGDLVNEVKFQDLFVNNPSHVPVFSNWVFRDFSDVKYKGRLNTKGFTTFAGYKKDIYYLYQSFLRTDAPIIHIVGPHYFLRTADSTGQGPVKIYSNAASLRLTVNGANAGTQANGLYSHPNGEVINNVFFWSAALETGRNDLVATDDAGNTDRATVYYTPDGNILPDDAAAKIINLMSDNRPVFFIGAPLADQQPFYYEFDGTADNTFDRVPEELSGVAGWIATERQSDVDKTSRISFDLAADADVYVMFTKQTTTPSWMTRAGFSNTGIAGRWRDNGIKLVDFQLFKRTFARGSHVDLGGSPIDFVVIIR